MTTTTSERAVPILRKAMGIRLRELRKERSLSQEALGKKASLSGKFLGEVERGEKSISTDSLYRVGKALGLGLVDLVGGQSGVPAEVEQIYALLARKPPAVIKRALKMLAVAVA